jgi:uncharacterized protein YbaR (Trm112 family)/SAM-dependent methyltransferase
MSLYDILACPICKVALDVHDDCVVCRHCQRAYPIVNHVPIMLIDQQDVVVEHEQELPTSNEYAPWLHRMIVQSLTDEQVVVDVGSGNIALDDPCIIRMDVTLTLYTDVVADLHALPFLPNSIDYIFALAVFEHLRQPFTAAQEIYAALKPGGYVYAECNFVYAYHGYPHHYFNASIQGLQQVFAQFWELQVGVAPYQMPGFALQQVLSSYLKLFVPQTTGEEKFARLLRSVLRHPLYQYDVRFTPDLAFRVAAGDYFLGMKRSHGQETIIPAPILKVYAASQELQARYPCPERIYEPDNLMFWAWREGQHTYPGIRDYFAQLAVFSKYGTPPRTFDRSAVRSWPPIPDPATQHVADERTGSMWRYLIQEARRHYRVGGFALLWHEVRGFLNRLWASQRRLIFKR